MKKVLLVILTLVGFVAYYVQSSKLTEEHVRAFYEKMQHATLDRKPEDLCKLMAGNFTSTGTLYVGGQRKDVTQNKKEACEGLRDLYETWRVVGEKMGGILFLDYGYEIHSITISPDNKTATVEISYSLDVSGTIMKIRETSTETLIRRFGNVRQLRSEFQQAISSGS